jgi:hypothetical protein
MIGTQDLESIIKLCLYSGHLSNEVPVSLLIIASVEEGKSELVKLYADNDGVAFPHDATAYGIIKAYSKRLTALVPHEQRIRHIVFPEFIHCLRRTKETVGTLLAFLNGLVGEGVKEIQTFAVRQQLSQPMSAGIIVCLAIDEFDEWKANWGKSGFLSRLLPVTYTYSGRIEEQIFDNLFGRGYKSEVPFHFNWPPAPADIVLPKPFAAALKPVAKEIAKSISQTAGSFRTLRGFRSQVALQRLAMASALSEGRDWVEQKDIDLVTGLAIKYMNFNYHEIT